MTAIPKTEQQRSEEGLQKMADPNNLLSGHGDFALIDSLVKTYPQYTHDDIFKMSHNEVMSLVVLNRQTAYLDSNIQSIKESFLNKRK